MKAVIFAIGAGLCWGIGEVCTRSALHSGKVGPITAITLRSMIALPILLLAYLAMMRAFGGLRQEPALGTIDGSNWMKIVLGSGVVAGALAMVLFYSALSIGEVSIVKPIAFAIAPAVGVTLGWLVLGESMSVRKALAVALIIAGVVLLTVAPAREDGVAGAPGAGGLPQ